MEKNNDPSTSSGTNKNKNVEELTDEQLKEVAGGGATSITLCIHAASIEEKCIKRDSNCRCTECEAGWTIHVQNGNSECVRQ